MPHHSNAHPEPAHQVICFEWGMNLNLNRNVVLAEIYVSIAKGFYAKGTRHKGDTSHRRWA